MAEPAQKVDLALDPVTGDLVFANRDLATLSGAELVQQRLAITPKMFKGEWFLDADAGIPYFQEILKKGVATTVVDAILRKAVLDTEDVNRLLTYTPAVLDKVNRIISVAFTVDTVYGPVTYEGALV